jgi:tRNA G18 (ribose-2'-O)-methylase SpoU
MTTLERRTREEIANSRKEKAKVFPVSIGCINLHSEGNVGFIVRSAACFGAKEVFVIGSLPDERLLRQFSCSMNKYINIRTFKNTRDFLAHARRNRIHVISLEKCDQATSITDYRFPLDREICIITGNETTGITNDILANSDCIYIPNPGIASCMNTSQAANVALYEYVRQAMT